VTDQKRQAYGDAEELTCTLFFLSEVLKSSCERGVPLSPAALEGLSIQTRRMAWKASRVWGALFADMPGEDEGNSDQPTGTDSILFK